jgi:hypothetical protein
VCWSVLENAILVVNLKLIIGSTLRVDRSIDRFIDMEKMFTNMKMSSLLEERVNLLEDTGSDKHTSLQYYSVTYQIKKFIVLDSAN